MAAGNGDVHLFGHTKEFVVTKKRNTMEFNETTLKKELKADY